LTFAFTATVPLPQSSAALRSNAETAEAGRR
jgi:hypothetical protein